MGDVPAVTAKKTRRPRGSLGPTAHEDRYSTPSQSADHWLGKRARRDQTGSEALEMSRRNCAKVQSSWPDAIVSPEPLALPPPRLNMNTAGDGLATSRREAIRYFYVAILGSPPASAWRGRGGTISLICKQLVIGKDSRRHVEAVLNDITSQDDGEYYNASSSNHVGGRYPRLVDGTAEALVVCRAIAKGSSIGVATQFLNTHLEAQNLPRISWSSVQGYVSSSRAIMLHRRQSKKSGSQDPASKWAKARVGQGRQLAMQFALGAATSGHERRGHTRAATAAAGGFSPLHIDGIAYWDETHFKIRLGAGSKWEYVFCRDPETGLLCPPEEGGVWDEEKPTTSVKFPGEARLLFGVGTVRVGNGALEGRKSNGFSYTGCTVVGWKKFFSWRSRPSCGARRRSRAASGGAGGTRRRGRAAATRRGSTTRGARRSSRSSGRGPTSSCASRSSWTTSSPSRRGCSRARPTSTTS